MRGTRLLGSRKRRCPGVEGRDRSQGPEEARVRVLVWGRPGLSPPGQPHPAQALDGEGQVSSGPTVTRKCTCHVSTHTLRDSQGAPHHLSSTPKALFSAFSYSFKNSRLPSWAYSLISIPILFNWLYSPEIYPICPFKGPGFGFRDLFDYFFPHLTH